MKGEIINRVALSPLVSFDLSDYHDSGTRTALDIAPQLFQGMILREKDFRAWVKETDWAAYEGHHVWIHCSIDAIIPDWAWLLVAISLEPFAKTLVFGNKGDLEKEIWRKALDTIDYEALEGKKIVVKGCSDIDIPTATYVEFIRRLRPIATKLMYGEPCSTVPLYKKPKQS